MYYHENAADAFVAAPRLPQVAAELLHLATTMTMMTTTRVSSFAFVRGRLAPHRAGHDPCPRGVR